MKNFWSKWSMLVWVCIALGLSACGKPEDYMFDAIKDKGYIPYTTPMASAGVGTIVSGDPAALHVAVNPQTCFPDTLNGKPTNLRWVTDTDLPYINKKMSFGFDVALSSMLLMGTPLINLKLEYQYARKVELKFEEASIEMLDEVYLREYYGKATDTCRHFLDNYPFISQALRVNKMSFNFYQANGVGIRLTPEIVTTMVDIGLGVNWHIEDEMTLVISTPKYIGYQVSKMNGNHNGYIGSQAHTLKDGQFDFQPVGSSASGAPALKAFGSRLRLAEPLPRQPVGLQIR